LGTFTDFIAAFNFTLIDPGSAVSAAFDPVNLTGIGSFAIDQAAALGDSFLGQLVLTYDLYLDLSDPINGLLSTDNRVTHDASVLVTGKSSTPVPLPSTLILVLSALPVLGLKTKRWRQRKFDG